MAYDINLIITDYKYFPVNGLWLETEKVSPDQNQILYSEELSLVLNQG